MMTGGFVMAFCFTFIAGILNEENADSLMAGYNTMSDEKKKKVDFKGLTRLYKQTFYTMAVLIAVLSLFHFIVDDQRILIISIVLTCSSGLSFLMIRSKRYDANSYKKWETVMQYLILLLLIAGGVLISYFIWTRSF